MDPSLGEFVLTSRDLRIPENPKTIHSVNEGNYSLWDGATKQFVENCKNAAKP